MNRNVSDAATSSDSSDQMSQRLVDMLAGDLMDDNDNDDDWPVITQSASSNSMDSTGFNIAPSPSPDRGTCTSSAEPEHTAAKPPQKKRRRKTTPTYKVSHDYHDYSQTSYSSFMKSHPNRKQPRPMKYQKSFPKALHSILDLVATTDQEDIISWLPHGRALKIHKKDEFVAKILPVYFTQSKFTSFQRQLNIYGFRRLTQGPDAGAYYHELFLRGRVDLCQAMCRTKIKGTHHKGANNPDEEPDFYSLPFMGYATGVPSDTGAFEQKMMSDFDSMEMHCNKSQPSESDEKQVAPITPRNEKPSLSLKHSLSAIVTPTTTTSKNLCDVDSDTKSILERMLCESDTCTSIGTIDPIPLPPPFDIDPRLFQEEMKDEEEEASAKGVSLCTEDAYDLNLPFKTNELQDDVFGPPLVPSEADKKMSSTSNTRNGNPAPISTFTKSETEYLGTAAVIPEDIDIASITMSSEEKVGEGELFQDFKWL